MKRNKQGLIRNCSPSSTAAVVARWGYKCAYCDKTITRHTGTRDHFYPLSQSRNNSPGNLVAACKACNCGKQSTPPEVWLTPERFEAVSQRLKEIASQTAHIHRALNSGDPQLRAAGLVALDNSQPLSPEDCEAVQARSKQRKIPRWVEDLS